MENSPIPPQDIEKNKELAALSYLWIFSLIILIARRDSPFVQLHARQGLILFILSILLWPVGFLRLGELLILALMILGFIRAATGSVYRIPVIGDIAEGHFGWNNLRKGWHVIKHTAIRLVKPEHVTPMFREELKKQQENVPKQDEVLFVQEEKKLSSLFHRVEEDEKKIHELEDQVRQMETRVH